MEIQVTYSTSIGKEGSYQNNESLPRFGLNFISWEALVWYPPMARRSLTWAICVKSSDRWERPWSVVSRKLTWPILCSTFRVGGWG